MRITGDISTFDKSFTGAVFTDDCVLIHESRYRELTALEERIVMKIRQLEAEPEFENREAYVKALRWALQDGRL